jgi:hypothetical protein
MTLFSLPLVLPRTSHYTRLGVGPEATAEEIRAASARIEHRLKSSGADAQELTEAHAVDLESSTARAAHDDARPPLALMRLLPAWPPLFEDRATALFVLRRELETFLADQGEPVHHPSDLTRTDFTADFTPDPLLDEPREDLS